MKTLKAFGIPWSKNQNNLMSFREIPSVFDLKGLFRYFSAFVEYIAMSLILSHWRSKVKCRLIYVGNEISSMVGGGADAVL